MGEYTLNTKHIFKVIVIGILFFVCIGTLWLINDLFTPKYMKEIKEKYGSMIVIKNLEPTNKENIYWEIFFKGKRHDMTREEVQIANGIKEIIEEASRKDPSLKAISKKDVYLVFYGASNREQLIFFTDDMLEHEYIKFNRLNSIQYVCPLSYLSSIKDVEYLKFEGIIDDYHLLKEITGLKEVHLFNATDEQVKEIQLSLPGCKITSGF